MAQKSFFFLIWGTEIPVYLPIESKLKPSNETLLAPKERAIRIERSPSVKPPQHSKDLEGYVEVSVVKFIRGTCSIKRERLSPWPCITREEPFLVAQLISEG